MLAKILFISFILVSLSSCLATTDNEIKGGNNDIVSKEVVDVDKRDIGKDKIRYLAVNKNEGEVLNFNTLQFADKSMDQIISFFQEYNIKFDKDYETDSRLINNQEGKLSRIDAYDVEKFPEGPSTAWYFYNNKVYMLSTPVDEFGKCNLSLYILDSSGNVDQNILIKDINYLEPLYVYDFNKLYYSSDTLDGKSILGVVDLDDYSKEDLVKYDFSKEDDKYSGEVITLISKQGDEIIYQLSTFENQDLIYDKPKISKIKYLLNHKKVLEIGNSTYDSIKQLGTYIICHDRAYNDGGGIIEVFDDNFNLIYSLDNNPIERLMGLMLLKKDGREFLFVEDGLGTHYIVDLEKNKENYQINNISTVGRDLNIVGDSMILRSLDGVYVGDKDS